MKKNNYIILVLAVIILFLFAGMIKLSGRILPETLIFTILVTLMSVGLDRYLTQPAVKSRWLEPVIDAILSFLWVILAFKLKIHTFFDDAGFYLRYLDHFREGYFFTFNPAEGPIWGISSFIYGVLGGLLVQFPLLSTDQWVLLMAAGGNWLFAFINLRLANLMFSSALFKYMVFALLFTGTKLYTQVSISGLETPIHLSILWLCWYFFLKKQNSLFLLFAALSLISKLDSAPVVGIMGLIFILDNYQSLLKPSFQLWQKVIFFFILPLVVFWGLVYFIFGSPLPHSAYAKLQFHQEGGAIIFKYFQPFLKDKILKSLWITTAILWVVHAGYVIRKRLPISAILPFLFFLGILGSYWYFNPDENMLWYYAMPGMFLSWQLVLSLHQGLNLLLLKGRKLAYVMVLLPILLLLVNDNLKATRWMNRYLHVVENERVRIGEYLGRISQKNDYLMAGHGFTSRYFKGFVLDVSGLNSRLTTDMNLDRDKIIDTYHPSYIIHQAWPYYLNLGKTGNYSLRKVFYDISEFNMPVWLLLQKSDSGQVYFRAIQQNEITGFEEIHSFQQGFKVKGNNITIQLNGKGHPEPELLIFGVKRYETDFYISVSCMGKDSLLAEKIFNVEKTGFPGAISRFVREIQVPVPAGTHQIRIRPLSPLDKKLVLVSPFLNSVSDTN